MESKDEDGVKNGSLYRLHATMVSELSKLFGPNTGNEIMENRWKFFTLLFQRPGLLPAFEARHLNDMSDVVKALMKAGLIQYGNYERLKKIMSRLRLIQCERLITEFERKMQKTSDFDALPVYITTEEDRKLYQDSLAKGKEKYRHIRVLFVGHECVGKTTLCEFLTTGKVPNLQDRPSTYGADIFLHLMEIDWNTKNWIHLNVQEEDIIVNRLGIVCASTENHQKLHVKNTTEVEESQPAREEKPNSIINISPITSPTTKEIVTAKPQLQIKDDANSPASNKASESVFNEQYPEEEEEEEEEEIKYDPFEGRVLHAKKMGLKKIANVSFWDFAGQNDFYSTHHIFLSPDGVFVVVCNAKKCLEGKDEEKRLERDKIVYWLRSLKTYSTSSEEEKDSPPIIVAGTHGDELENSDDGQHKLVDFVCELLDRHEINGITVEWCILVDYKKDRKTLRALRKNIEEAAPKQDQWETDIPAKWLSLEHLILKEKANGKKVLSLDRVKKLNKNIKAPIEKDEEIKLFLRYLHASRHVIYFDEDRTLSEDVIIDPKWLVDAFRCLITSEQFIREDKLKLHKLLKNLKLSGKLTDDLIDCAWQEKFIDNKKLLLSVMERFGLISLPEKFQKNERSEERFYIVPSVLKTLNKHPDMHLLCQTRKDLIKRGCCLYLKFEQIFVPNEIYDRLIACCISNKTPTFDFDKCVFRHFGFFRVNSVFHFAVHCHHSFITLSLWGSVKTDDSVGGTVRKWIEDWLQKILKLNRQECFKYTYCLHQDFVENPKHLIPLEDIKLYDIIPCYTENMEYSSVSKSDAEFWGVLPKTEVVQEQAERPNNDPGSNGNFSTVYKTYNFNVGRDFKGDDIFCSKGQPPVDKHT